MVVLLILSLLLLRFEVYMLNSNYDFVFFLAYLAVCVVGTFDLVVL